jgi:hypothetical protein
MATANTFIPIVGQLDAPFAITSGNDSPILRSADPALQGDPRPGVLRWVLLLVTPDPTADSDNNFRVTVPVPEAIDMSEVATELNTVVPLVSVSPTSSASAVAGATLSGLDPVARTITVTVDIEQVATNSSYNLVIDFCHSAIN